MRPIVSIILWSAERGAYRAVRQHPAFSRRAPRAQNQPSPQKSKSDGTIRISQRIKMLRRLLPSMTEHCSCGRGWV